MTAGEQRRLLGLERRKARQLRWAKRHNQGRYSHRLRRTIAQIAALRARQARRRLDFTHKLTTDLAKSHGWVAIENLRVKGMTRSAKGTVHAPGRNVRQKAGLNRAILDNAPYERRRQLAYKAPPVRVGAAAGGAGVHVADVLGVRAPRPRIAAGLRAGVRLHRLRPPGARRPQRCTQHRMDCRRAGGRQHAQSPSGGEAHKEPHA